MAEKSAFERYLDAFKVASASPMAATANFQVMLERADRVYERAREAEAGVKKPFGEGQENEST